MYENLASYCTKNSILSQITSETNVAQEKANASLLEVQGLELRVDDVKAAYQLNQRHLDDTTIAVDQADLKAKKAANDAQQLEDVRPYLNSTWIKSWLRFNGH